MGGGGAEEKTERETERQTEREGGKEEERERSASLNKCPMTWQKHSI